MNKQIIKLLQNTWGLLVFALLSGCAYYAVVLKFIYANTNAGGNLLGFFFLPLIVCGAALVIIKLVKQCMENGREGAAAAIFWSHAAFIVIAAVTAASMFV